MGPAIQALEPDFRVSRLPCALEGRTHCPVPQFPHPGQVAREAGAAGHRGHQAEHSAQRLATVRARHMSTGTVAFSCFHCCCPGSRAPKPGRTPGRDSWAAHRSCSRPAVGLRGLGCMPAALRGSGRHRQCSRRLLSSRPSPLGPTELWGWPLIPCWPRWVIPGAGGGLSVLS